jgi:hypothetical protein
LPFKSTVFTKHITAILLCKKRLAQKMGTRGAPWNREFVGVDGYVNDNYEPANHKVVAKLGNNLYMMYDHRKGINTEVAKYGDQVTMVKQASEDNSQSWLGVHLVDGWGGIILPTNGTDRRTISSSKYANRVPSQPTLALQT